MPVAIICAVATTAIGAAASGAAFLSIETLGMLFARPVTLTLSALELPT